jgi:hypothetical protein
MVVCFHDIADQIPRLRDLKQRIVDFSGEPETPRQVRTHRCLFPLISYHTLLLQLNGGYIQLTMSLGAVTAAVWPRAYGLNFRGREAELYVPM